MSKPLATRGRPHIRHPRKSQRRDGCWQVRTSSGPCLQVPSVQVSRKFCVTAVQSHQPGNPPPTPARMSVWLCICKCAARTNEPLKIRPGRCVSVYPTLSTTPCVGNSASAGLLRPCRFGTAIGPTNFLPAAAAQHGLGSWLHQKPAHPKASENGQGRVQSLAPICFHIWRDSRS